MDRLLKYFMIGIKALTPPKHVEGRDIRDTHWRWAVFVMIVFTAFILSLHIAMVKGFFEPFGYSAVAYSAEVRVMLDEELKPVREQLDASDRKSNSILFAIYAPQIRQKVRERCDTTSADLREKINRELNFILREYEELAGKPFLPMPRCGEV